MQFTYEELEQRLKIDLAALDSETSDHVQLYHEVGKGYRLALSERDKAKLRSKEVYAETLLDVRAFLEEENGKVTESMVSSQAEIDEDYRKVLDQLQQAEEELNKWSNLKSSYEQKSYALRDIIQLYVAGYFGALPATSAGAQKKQHDEERKLEKFSEERKKQRENGEESSLTKRQRERQRISQSGEN